MTGPDPAVQAVRLAVRSDLRHVSREWPVLVACSGGADSLALLAATVFEARRHRNKIIGVTVDHDLQDGSAANAERVVAQMAELGVHETASIKVTVDPGPRGMEAGAREARYAALEQLAVHFRSRTVLLGHTLDDQAETVLLGLTRGSGGRSIAGMRPQWYAGDAGEGLSFWRPLLEVTRAQTEAACRAEGIDFWTDPHNEDPRFTRSRIRHTVMPMLERELGPGIGAALARTGEMLQDDLNALDDLADQTWREVRSEDGLDAGYLETFPEAIRSRVVRFAALEAGAIPSDLTRRHIHDVSWIVIGVDEGQQIQLPGHVTAYRDGNLLKFRRTLTG